MGRLSATVVARDERRPCSGRPGSRRAARQIASRRVLVEVAVAAAVEEVAATPWALGLLTSRMVQPRNEWTTAHRNVDLGGHSRAEVSPFRAIALSRAGCALR